MSAELRRARNRQMLIFLLVCVGMLALLGRLYYWQIARGSELATRATNEHIQNLVLNAPRGLIYDAQGHILATNVVRDDVYIEPIQFKQDHSSDTFQSDLAQLVGALHQVLPTVSTDTLYKDFNLNAWTVRIASRIEPERSQRLSAMHLADTFLQPRTWRIYPQGTTASQVLGFVQESDQASVGAYGIERQYNALLAGKPGSFTAETDLNGDPLVVGASAEQPAVPGANLTLTINSTIEYMAETGLADAIQQLKAESGSVVVLNARTGAVVALAGAPSFDPNQYGSFANTRGCLGTEEVFLNPALYCAYEPGSTMKAVTMAAALDQGLITPDTTVYDPGFITFPDAAVVRNWEDRGYGTETMTQVLEHSANVGSAYVAHTILGPARYYPYLSRFGFGQSTGIDSKEEVGTYRSPGNDPSGWSMSDLTRQAFGQSILATPLQVAMAYLTIANAGVSMRPYLVASINNNGHIVTTQPQVVRQVISAHTAAILTDMLEHVVTNGLAQPVQVPGYTVAAKTGTATTQGTDASQTEASVAGFIPASNPQFVILVKIDRPQVTIYGGTAAAPLWKAIAQELMWYYHVSPDAV
ncbi:MAG TPA: penicillin-binding protein 2 [Ktedonobacteraceae bacterium]|nr:penicillin-binding protein 2 [Ktedonobacteraceae bacterium]